MDNHGRSQLVEDSEAPVGLGSTVTGPLRILFVDGDDTIRDAMITILAWFGHEMRSASRGQEAVEISQTENFDLVITDFQLQDMTGLEVAARIRMKNPAARIILLTGWSAANLTNVPACIDRVLAKPATMQTVLDTIESLFRKQ